MSVNQRIKQVRQELNLSQVKFASQISISSGYLAGIEVEKRNVNDRLIRLVCIMFHVSEDWLRTGEGKMFDEPTDPAYELAYSTFRKLKPPFPKYVLNQIDQLLELQGTEEK